MTLPTAVLLVSPVVFAVVGLSSSMTVARLVMELRENHRATWENLRRPEILGPSAFASRALMMRFILTNQYESLKSSKVSSLVQRVRALGAVGLLAFLAAATALLTSGHR